MTEPARVRLRITGRVQGVGFRYAAYDEARRLGLRGWVRNLSDGRVETLAEGPDAAVDAYVAWCRRGPSMSRVTAVDVDPHPAAAAARDFEIRA